MGTALRTDLVAKLERQYGSIMKVPEDNADLQALRESALIKTRRIGHKKASDVSAMAVKSTVFTTKPRKISDITDYDALIRSAKRYKWTANRLYREINNPSVSQLVTYNSIITRAKKIGIRLPEAPLRASDEALEKLDYYIVECTEGLGGCALDLVAFECNQSLTKDLNGYYVTPHTISARKIKMKNR